MTPLAQNGQRPANTDDTRDVLNHTKSIRTTIKSIEDDMLSELKSAQQASLNAADSSMASASVEAMSDNILKAYRLLVSQIRDLKSDRANQDPNSMRGAQVKAANDALEASMTKYRNLDNEFKKKLKEQIARQYRIVRPDASEQEVRQAVDDPNGAGNVFAQTLMQSDRRGQSQSAMNAVKSRHVDIQKIEQQLIELSDLFSQMNELVEQQEAAIENIEMKGEEVVENMDKGTEQIGVAITSARNARKWKWWCLGICSMYKLPKANFFFPLLICLIVLIIAIIVIALVITKPWQAVAPKAARRSLPIQSRRVVSEFTKPIGERTVKVGEDYTPLGKRFRKFQS
jgi:syntaxin 1B/2/3